MRIQNGPPFIIDCSSPWGSLARGSVPQMLQYIYAPPQNRPISGGAKQILIIMVDAASLGRAPMPELSPIGGTGFLYCFFNAYAATRVH